MSKKRRGEVSVQSKPNTFPWVFLALAVLTLIFYANSFKAGLLFDSAAIIREDPRLRAVNLTNIAGIWKEHYWWPSRETDLYRPLTTFTYLFNYTILGSGENPAGYHVVNLLLHWANASLVFVLLRRLAGRVDVAVLTACLFLVHPVNTEAVTNIVGRADLLAAFSVLLAGWCYLRSNDPGARRTLWLTAMGVIACLGVLAKENAVMIVGFVGIYDLLWRWLPRSQAKSRLSIETIWKESGPAYIALIPCLVLILAIRIWISRKTVFFAQIFVDNPLVGAEPVQRLLTATGVLGRYLKLLVFPSSLSPDYSFNQIPLYGTPGNSAADTLAWVSLVSIVLLFAAGFWLYRGNRIFSWGVLFFFTMMLPTSNILMVIGSIMAERFLYLPSVGFCAATAAVVCSLPKWQVSAVRWVVPAFLVAVLGIRTIYRNADWRDDVSLWSSAAAVSPASFRTHMAYGNAVWTDAQRTGKPAERALDEAIAQAEIAQSILSPDPPIPQKWQNNMVHVNLGENYGIKADLLKNAGRHDEAAQYYKKSIDALVKARELDRLTNEASRDFRLRQGVSADQIFDVGNFVIYKLLGMTYCKVEQWDACEMAGRYLEHLAPDEPTGYLLVGAAASSLKRPGEAAVQFLAGLLLDPQSEILWSGLQATYIQLGLPNPVINNASSKSLNSDMPQLRQQLNEAAAMVVRLFENAKRAEPARQAREQFIKQYSVPPEVFSR